MNYRAICSVLRAEEMMVIEEEESVSRVVRGAQGLLQQLHNSVIEDSVIVCEADLYILMLYVCALVYLVQKSVITLTN